MRRRTFRTLAGGAAAGLAVSGLSLAVVAPASAATTEVGTEEELREAVAAANASPGLDRIVLANSITLSTVPTGEEDGPAAGDLDVTDTLEVIGNGETINAAGTDRIFDVPAESELLVDDIVLRNGAPALESSGGAIRSLGTLAVVNSLLVDNTVTGPNASGGAIVNDGGSLTVDTSRLRGNSASRAGGAIEAVGGTTQVEGSRMTGNSTGPLPGNGGGLHLTGTGEVRVIDSLLINNVAASEGGGLWNSSTGTMTVRGTYLTENIAQGAAADNGGGALFNDGGTLVVRGSSLDDNEATGTSGSGGGLLNLGAVRVFNTQAFDNRASRAGGAIEAVGGTTELTGVQLFDNIAGSNPGNGGAVHLTGAGEVSLTEAAVVNNRAANEGGGLWNSADGTMTVTESVVARNVANGDAADSGGGGVYNDGGELNLSSVDLRENEAAGTAGSGGGVLNVLAGELTADDVRLRGNLAQRAGGGIETVGGTTELTDTTFETNVVATNPGNGGAFHITGEGTVSYIGGLVAANRAGNEGGGLWNSTGTMLVRDVVLRGNVARGGAASDNGGGALYNDGGTLRVQNSRLARNRAPVAMGSGGGILNNQGTLVVRASDLVENASARAGGGIETNAGRVGLVNVDLLRNRTADNPGNGGGLHTTDAGVVDYIRGSVIGNIAASEGGGLWNSATGTMTVDDVIVRRNEAPVRPNLYNDGGTFTFDGRPVPVG